MFEGCKTFFMQKIKVLCNNGMQCSFLIMMLSNSMCITHKYSRIIMTCTEKCCDFCYILVFFLNITNSMNNLTKSTNFDHINYKYLLFLKIRNSYTGHNHCFFKI